MPPLFYNNYSHLFLEAADKLGITYRILTPTGLIEFTKNHKTFRIFKTQLEINNPVGAALCRSKYSTNLLLSQNGLPCPKQYFCQTLTDAKNAFVELGAPLILKPNNGRQGRHVFFIHSLDQIPAAVANIKRLDDHPVAEAFCPGIDHRFLVLNNEVIGIVKREPPQITGDGHSTIRELIKANGHIPLDTHTKQVLAKQQLALDNVLPPQTTVPVRHTANFSSGGAASTLKNTAVSPSHINLALQAAGVLGMTLVGIDMLIHGNQAVITEANAMPGIMMHHFPTSGDTQPVAETILKTLFSA